MIGRQIGKKNASVLRSGPWEILFSYDTPVAAYNAMAGYFRTEEHYSKTTTCHINQWIGSVKAQTRPHHFFADLAEKAQS